MIGSPVTETKLLIAGHELVILAAMGITPNRKRNEHINCPMPGHVDKNASWRWDYGIGKWTCTCTGNGYQDVLDLIQLMGLAGSVMEACAYARAALGLPPIGGQHGGNQAERDARIADLLRKGAEIDRQQRELEAKTEAESRLRAKTLYDLSIPGMGTLAETYLRSRAITCKLTLAIRFIEAETSATIKFLRPSWQGWPLMLVPFGFDEEHFGGVHLTRLLPDGTGKAPDEEERSKRTVGKGHDYPIVVTEGAGHILLITEGIEDALSCHQATGCPAWAAGTANRLPKLREHIGAPYRCVAIQQDQNKAGIEGSTQLAEDLAARGIEVRIFQGDDNA